MARHIVRRLYVALSISGRVTPPIVQSARSYSVRSDHSISNQISLCNHRLHTHSVAMAKKDKKHQTKVDVSRSVDEELLNLDKVRQDMQGSVDDLKQSYMKSLSLRTSQGVFDNIQVTTDAGKFPLNQLGQITAKSANMMVINLTSFPEATQAAAKAISESGLNLNPLVTGSVIEVPVPKVTREHREQLAKQAKAMSDKSKVSLRQIRANYISKLKKHKNTTSKDTLFMLEKQIGQIADTTAQSLEQLLAAKAKELLGK